MLDMKSADNKKGLVFTGIKKTEMLLNEETNRWTIISLDDKSVIMELDIEVNNHNNYTFVCNQMMSHFRKSFRH